MSFTLTSTYLIFTLVTLYYHHHYHYHQSFIEAVTKFLKDA